MRTPGVLRYKKGLKQEHPGLSGFLIQDSGQGIILHKGVFIIKKQQIRDLRRGDLFLKIIAVITGIYNDDPVEIRQQELDKAVGVRIFQDQQISACIIQRRNGDLRIIPTEEDLIFVLLFQCAANALEYRPESVFSVWSASMRSVLSDHFDLEERT